ncbi:MAG: alpha/beta hydrolase [Hyphomonadaceae bacterium]|nr:alpha/beta hydrolase [Hyphomonadaceae bacterium]
MTTDRRKFLGVMAGAGAAVGAAALASSKALAQQVTPQAPQAPVYPDPPPAAPGPIRIPVPGSVAPLKNKTDYEALRQKRIAEVDDETRYINFRDIPPPSRAPMPEGGLAPGVKAYNVDVDGADGKFPMRIYMPDGAKKPIGIYLHTHGGGWGGFEGFDPRQDATNSGYVKDWGCAVAAPDFRVSWDAKFPASIDDCFAAYKHLLGHDKALGIDKTRIGIGGGCTGANLATVIALMARDAKVQKPAIQWLWSGVFDTRNNTQSYDEFAKYSLPLAIADTVTNFYLSKREDVYDWRSSPILAKTMKGLSPALIWAGEWEVLRDESQQYYNRLRDAGVDVTYIEGPQQPHGGIYSINPVTGQPTKYSRETVPLINKIMRRYIGPR